MTILQLPDSGQALLTQTAVYFDPSDQALVGRALEMATAVHGGNFRLDGTPYIDHPVAVAQMLASWSAPPPILAAALLHDVLKEKYAACPSLVDIEERVGTEVAGLVRDISRLGRVGHIDAVHGPEEQQDRLAFVTEHLPWVALTLQRSPFAIVIKMADRLHNFQSLQVLSPERQVAFAARTMNVFVPFAERLGMRAAKRELEDEAFRVLQPEKYRQMRARYRPPVLAEAMTGIITRIEQQLQKKGLDAHVEPKPRSYYAFYRRETAQGKQVPLPVAQPVQIMVDDKQACYRALGLVHALWSPQPGKIIDYIAAPKPNGYRALHTRVRYPPGETLLILICDRQMDLVAEQGIVASWSGVAASLLPQLPAWQEPPAGKIAVLTPDGDLLVLPEEATPIDFAYAVHLGLGHQCTGALVNGRPVSLDRPLESGDVVKILTSSASVGPSPDWLTIVKTSRARAAIRRWIRSQNPGDAAEKGWSLLDAELRREGMLLSSPQVTGRLEAVAGEMGYESRRDLLVAVGLGQRQPAKVASHIQKRGQKKRVTPALQATIVSLAESALPQRLAGCCNPLPPDPIVGYVTRHNVVSIHRADCKRVKQLRPLLNAEWNTEGVQGRAEIEILAIDRLGLVRDVSTVIAEAGISMIGFYADRMPDGSARFLIGLGDTPRSQLEHTLNRLRRVADVRQAELLSPGQGARFGAAGKMARHFANPYTLRPVSGKGFYGRRAELRDLVNNLRGVRPGEAVLLWGARRVGKTSLLLEFQQRIIAGEDYLPVFVDMQRLSGRSITFFLFDIVKSIARALADSGVKPPTLNRMKRDPLAYFRGFLENEPRLQDRQLVLILDEFQLLATLHQEKVAVADINRYFRSLIQHRRGLSMIFSGGGVLDTLLQQPDTSFMLEVARHQKIDCLDPDAARQLIVEPVQRGKYDQATVERLLALTAGHPYYLQWLCGELVDRIDREQQANIGDRHLQQLLDDWLPDQGEQYFSHLWGSVSGVKRSEQQRNKVVLTAISETGDIQKEARWVSFDGIAQSGVARVMDESKLWRLLQDLVKMDTLERTDEEHYRIKVGLCELWLRANYTVDHVIKESNW